MTLRAFRRHTRPFARLLIAAFALCVCGLSVAHAAVTGKIQGRIVATDTGEPLGYADILLVPADTAFKRVGGFTNADGTFLLEAVPGRYTLQVRAISYAQKRFEGLSIEAGKLLPFSTALDPEALQQEEIVVEGRRIENTEASMLSARKKSSSLGDAISAEQVRKSPDKDAAEVLRRVTGLSVADGKYVFVRGLGERYSSTEVDGVRIASPEQNKRVVPLDLVPANLLDNIIVQKTYTADRPGEFGGGDVQVRTKDFPGQRTWSFSVSQGYAEGVTFQKDRKTYGSFKSDLFGFGARDRGVPAPLSGVELPAQTGANLPALSSLAKSFSKVWTPNNSGTIPNATYSATYGDEFRLFGRQLGLIQSWSYSRSFDQQIESQRFFQGTDTLYDYSATRYTESAQLGGLAAFSYRLSPSHSLHMRGLYSNSADDEVRIYEGADHNRDDAVTGTPIQLRNTRLMYVQRNVLSGSVEGKHSFANFLGSNVDWKFGRSSARRQQPDRRELTYQRFFYFEGDTAHWVLGSTGRREFGDLTDDGWGTTVTGTVPYQLFTLGKGKIAIGYDRQTKERDNFYRRFNIVPSRRIDGEAPPESLFADPNFDGQPGSGTLEDATLNQPQVGLDNYRADQKVSAGFVSIDAPFGRRVRANLGLRVETGYQNVESFALFSPDEVLQKGELDDTDWLPSGNLTWSVSEAVNLRLAASQTVSRPDLNELSPSPFLEYIGGMLVSGNPNLRRALLDNYDLRIESFPGISEVFAVGVFYKNLREPIEQVIQGGTPPLLIPRNSAKGRNRGIELEARTRLDRVWKGFEGFSLNSNASFIKSEVELYPQISQTGSQKHPLQGQANYLLNVGLSYTSKRHIESALLLNATGKRLRTLGLNPLPDVYQQPFETLDATVGFSTYGNTRVKLSARNLLDPRIQELQNGKEVSGYRAGKSYSVALSFGM